MREGVIYSRRQSQGGQEVKADSDFFPLTCDTSIEILSQMHTLLSVLQDPNPPSFSLAIVHAKLQPPQHNINTECARRKLGRELWGAKNVF